MQIKSTLEKMNFLDIHYHVNPDMYIRSHNAIDIGKILTIHNGAAIIKSHLGSTVEVAALAQEMGYPVFGSLVLNKIAGGLDFHLILAALAKYPMAEQMPLLVYFPTHTAGSHRSRLQRQLSHVCLKQFPPPVESVSENGHLKPAVEDVIRLAKDYPIRLATGHITGQEVRMLAELSARLDLKHLLVTHAAHPCCGLSLQDVITLSGAYSHLWFEQTALTLLLKYQNLEEFRSMLESVSQVIYSSDLGQVDQLKVDGWLQKSNEWFDLCNIAQLRRRQLQLDNAIRFFFS